MEGTRIGTGSKGMAKVLKNHSFSKRGAHRKYPWNEWTDGKVRETTKGEDFPGDPSSFRIRLYGKAREVGKKVRTEVYGDTVMFQFYDPKEEN